MASASDNLNQLESAYRCGHVSPAELVETREYLRASVDLPGPAPAPEVWHIIALLCIGAAGCTALGAWVLQDLTLALTLTATLMAAIAVRALNKLGD